MKLLLAVPAALLAAATASSPGSAGTTEPAVASDRVASYRIAASLDPDSKTVAGTETVTWRNSSPDLVGELRFHLYLNAFKSSRTTFLRESPEHLRALDGRWGWIDITSITGASGEDLAPRLEFVRPDDGNANDQTVARLPLPAPVRPGQSVTLTIGFTARLPKVVARTGFLDDFYMVAQWFPKLGVYESATRRDAARRDAARRDAAGGGWNCHQFHAAAEFFADFGVYDVTVTVPERFTVAAPGLLTEERHGPDGRATLRYRAEDVHDFAWTAWSGCIEATERWHHVAIRLLTPPERAGQIHRHQRAAAAALEYMDRHVGRYPYPTLTIVDPPLSAAAAGGMEYPMLITTFGLAGMPPGVRLPEQVTAHEVVHQYWYGMVASNEVDEAWLDEGVTQYFEARIMDELHGPSTSLLQTPLLDMGTFASTRAGYAGMRNPKIAPIATPVWKFVHGGAGALTYYKTAVVLKTLEGLIGRAAMDSALRTYFHRWRFRHPAGRDFIAAFDEVVPRFHGARFGTSLDWFFDQLLYGTDVCDYGVGSITNRRLGPATGLRDSAGAKVGFPEEASAESGFLGRVVILRHGEVRLPVTVLVGFADGHQVREEWDGQDRAVAFTYRQPAAVLWARVDPDNLLPIDRNLVNNSLTLDPPSAPAWKYAAKLLVWIQHLLQSLAVVG